MLPCRNPTEKVNFTKPRKSSARRLPRQASSPRSPRCPCRQPGRLHHSSRPALRLKNRHFKLKSEIRNSKSETNPKSETRIQGTPCFEFCASNLFRIS